MIISVSLMMVAVNLPMSLDPSGGHLQDSTQKNNEISYTTAKIKETTLLIYKNYYIDVKKPITNTYIIEKLSAQLKATVM